MYCGIWVVLVDDSSKGGCSYGDSRRSIFSYLKMCCSSFLQVDISFSVYESSCTLSIKLPCNAKLDSLLQVAITKIGNITEIGLSMTSENVVRELFTPLKHSDSIYCSWLIWLHSMCIS